MKLTELYWRHWHCGNFRKCRRERLSLHTLNTIVAYFFLSGSLWYFKNT